MIKVNGNEVQFEEFPNGETRIVEDSVSLLDFGRQTISFKYESDSDLIKLMFVKSFIDSRKKTSSIFELTIYYMPYSRMDRSENGSAFTLKYIADFINGLKFDRVKVIEPHSDVTPALLNSVEAKYINFDLLPIVMKEVGFDKEEDFIMFPDAGASKRYHNMRDIKNVLIGHKSRNFQTGKITDFNLVGDFEGTGNKVIIVDDLSSYGGTFVHSAKALREEGFEEIYLLVAHAENSIFKGKLFNYVDKVFTTDSILTEQNFWQNQKYEPQLRVFELKDIL